MGLLWIELMKLLFVFSVVSSILLVACGSSGDGNNAVTQPEIGDNNFEGLLESSSSLDMGGNGDVFVSSSSNALMSSSSVNISSANIEVSPESVVRGVMTDSRDGKTYKIVSIGSQTWMAENLNYMPSRCYDDDPLNCELYGGLYTAREAKEACPEGWHLPGGEFRGEEWKLLVETLDENNKPEECGSSVNVSGGIIACGEVVQGLKSSSGWATENGSDLYEFSILPAGGYEGYFSKVYRNKGLATEFWINGVSDNSSVLIVKLESSEKWVVGESMSICSHISVRCVKN